MKKCQIMILIILIKAALPAFAQNTLAYDSALELYKNQNYTEALMQFKQFIEANPQNTKADDALWYIGRIYKKTDQIEQAIFTFLKVLDLPKSNRSDEASNDLGSILYSQKKYKEVISLLEYTEDIQELDRYQLKSKELLAKSWYNLALREKQEYRNDRTADFLAKALELYNSLEPVLSDPSDIAELKYAKAKIYDRLSDIAKDNESYENYRNKAMILIETAMADLSDFYKPLAENLLYSLKKSGEVSFSGELSALGAINNLVENNLGGEIYAKALVDFPLSGRDSMVLDLRFKHDNFDFVSSNFDPNKTGDARFMQWTETLSADLYLKSGTRRYIYNKAKLFSDFQFAEDSRDNYINAGINDLGVIRFNPGWRMEWNTKFEWRTYPNYLISGRKLDYIKASLNPELKSYVTDWLILSIIYGIDYKQYLDSKYDTSNPAVSSTQNKAFLYNSGEFAIDLQAGDVYNPVISYKFTYQKSFNYDYWVSGFPSDRFIEAYYDNYSQNISLANKIKLGNTFKFDLKSDLILTNFLNYPARDDTKTFIDKIRSDLAIKLGADLSYTFDSTPGALEIKILLSGWWNYKISNMTYNETFLTNYTDMGIMLGSAVKLP